MESIAATASARALERLKALHPTLIDLSLERIARLLDILEHPENRLAPVFHVGGTNGKGSTVTFLRAMFEAAGKHVHVYTSPHLVNFHERIVLSGSIIEEEKLTDLLEECEAANAGAPITFFEITTVAAILAFAREPADAVLLEVGLGGRFDATNVVAKPAASIVTSVDLDHQHFLGDTIEAIAFEKAGIFKRGRPAVIAPQTPKAGAVLREQARKIGALPFVAEEDWHVHAEGGRLIYEDEGGLLDLPLPRLLGRHQFDNAGAALASLRAANMNLNETALAKGIASAYWPARLQRLTKGPLVTAAGRAELWLDGGHNPAAGRALAVATGELEEKVSAPLHLIVGMLQTKDAGGFLAPFRGLARSIHTVPMPAHVNALSPDALAHIALGEGLQANVAESPLAAIRRIVQEQGPQTSGARILICGSLYLAGEILRDNS